jgi:protocatechuate 3,4-dioxygenase, beta subunit
MLANRRLFMQMLSGGLAISLPGWSMAKGLWVPEDKELPMTPSQTDGPFYPETAIEKQLYNDSDLAQKIAGHEYAKGQVAVLSGTVTDRKGKPQAGAVVEAWQACAAGRYSHSKDNNPALLDNNFQFWGRAITAEDGKYSFKTIIPGLYPGRMGRHIHFRIDTKEFKRLTTQCYFDQYGDDNAKDSIYARLSSKERELVTVKLEKPSDKEKPWTGSFQIVVG